MEKSKRKSRQPIEFAAPFTLEACIVRLQERAEQEKQRSPRSKLVIQVISADEDTCRFVLRKSGATQSVLTAQGYLQRRDANSTLVVGKTSGALTPLIIFAVVVIPLALCALMFNVSSVVLPGAVITLVFMGGEWIYLQGEERKLTRLLQDLFR